MESSIIPSYKFEYKRPGTWEYRYVVYYTHNEKMGENFKCN